MEIPKSDGLEDDDETARAFESISQQLQQWTSPRVPSTGTWTSVPGKFRMEDDNNGLVFTSEAAATEALPISYTPSTYPYERNVMDWWTRELVDPAPRGDGEDNDDDDEIVPSSTSRLSVTRTSSNTSTPKKSGPTVERASTPVMSNASNKKKTNSKYGDDSAIKASSMLQMLRNLDEVDDDNDEVVGEDDEDEDMLPANVQSPWVEQQQDVDSGRKHPPQSSWMGSAYSATTPRTISPFRTQQYEYRRYHDGLLSYLKARRSLSHRIDINGEEQALALAYPNETILAPSISTDPKLIVEETKAELDFLRTLKSLCWERALPSETGRQQDLESRREGNFWALLHELRGLGFAALLWTDDQASSRQNALTSASFFESASTRIHASPKELVEDMTGNEAPLVLQRRRQILSWMEHCQDQLVSADTKTSVSMAASDNNNFSLSNLGTEKALQSCLELILAGRLTDARVLLRKAGQPWIAAKLGGGAPAGVDKVTHEEGRSGELVKVGNVNRSLWKQRTWKLSAKLKQRSSETSPIQAAIHSILANDYHTALENPALRSWEKGLFVVLHAMWGRSEDELLHLHNNHRRRVQPPFPGTQYQDYEKAQLQATCQLSNMTEQGLLELLAASPFEEMKGREHLCRAIAALLVGRMALVNYLAEETDSLTSDSAEEPQEKLERLRFVTHLLLYLDSLSACTTPVSLEGIHEYKNKALYAYVDHLANNEDLWHFLILYASLLPEEVLVSYFPRVLVRVEGEEEQRMMIEQARDLFPGECLDLVLRIVVRLVLDESDDSMPTNDESALSTPTRSDIRKMKAIQWLCFFEEHVGDALIAANMLLRQFLLSGKSASAIMFIHDFLPPEVIDVAMNSILASNNDNSVDAVAEKECYQALLVNARTEHIALHSYLKAIRAVDEWDLVIKTASFSETVVDDKLDSSGLTEREKAFARSMERRDLVRRKRKASKGVVESAERARKDLMNVLLHQGGWLADSDKDTGFKDNSEEGIQRKKEIKALRSRLLPNAVRRLLAVCSETATWMWNSLLEASPELGSTPKEVLETLDDPSSSTQDYAIEKPLRPLSPRYWTQKALVLAETVASDEFLILEAFDSAALQEVLAKISEISISDLMYSA